MNLSGIAVSVDAPLTETVARALAALPGVQVTHMDGARGRIVVVQEADDVAAEIAGFRAIQCIPGVVCADLVYHYFGDQPTRGAELDLVLARLEPATGPAAHLSGGRARNDFHARGMQ